jgi:hypothetical protein
LNLGLPTCKAGILPLEPHVLFISELSLTFAKPVLNHFEPHHQPFLLCFSNRVSCFRQIIKTS